MKTWSFFIVICLLLTAPGYGQLTTQNPLDDLKNQVAEILLQAGVPFTSEQETHLALVIEEQRQASEDLFGQIMDFRGGIPQGQERDRALAGIQWIHDEFKKLLPNYLTEEQRAAWEVSESSGQALGAVIGGSGAPPPRREMIQQIRINNNPFTSEEGGQGNFGNVTGASFGSGVGNQRTEIIQRGGGGAWHGNFSSNFQDDKLNARNPFAQNRPPYHERNINGNIDGPLIRDRLTIAFSANNNRQENVGTVKAQLLEGPYSLGVTRPNVSQNYQGRAILQLTDSQSFHFGGRYGMGRQENQGVGDFSLPSRGVNRENTQQNFDVRHIAVLSAKSVYETRLTMQKNHNTIVPFSDEVGINVLDAFRGGGAQERNEQRGRTISFGNLFYSAGEKLLLKAGIDGRHRRQRNRTESNFVGEFTFSDLESYRNGAPLKYRVTRGNPLVEVNQWEMAYFVQNDLRVTNRLTLFYGARYERQSNLNDNNNLDPRLAAAYAVGGSTVIRGGVGVLHNRIQDGVFLNLRRLDGTRQYEILVDYPSWPDPFQSGTAKVVPPSSRRVGDANLVAPYDISSSISLERTLPSNLFITISSDYNRGMRLLRSRNLNAPLPETGLKPFPEEGHIYHLESTGKSTYKNIRISMRQRFSIFNISARYTLASGYSNSDQPFDLPADNYDLRSQWGRSGSVERHSFNTNINSRLPFDVYLTTVINANSGTPYNITTGKDDNSDGQTNDRPDGVIRNSGDGPRYFNVSFNFSKAFRLGGAGGQGGGMNSGGGYQLSVFLNASNALNMTNPGTPSGVMTSPFFGKSFNGSAPREIEVGMRFQF